MFRILAPLGLGLAVFACSSSSRAEEPADDVLTSKGLRQSGSMYIVRAEDDVRKAAGVVEARLKEYQRTDTQQRAFQQGSANRKAMIEALTRQRSALNQQYVRAMPMIRAQLQALTREQAAMSQQLAQLRVAAQQGNSFAAAQHNQIVEAINALTERIDLLQTQGNQLTVALNEVTDQLDLLNQAGEGSEMAGEVRAQVGRRREAYVQALLELRTLVDAAKEQYATLAEDAEVKGTLEALNRRTPRIKYSLGPSQKFLDIVKALEKAEAGVLTDTLTLHSDNGVLWIDVTLNGKVTEPMVFDTGAALVSLPADLAARAGLVPGEADPTVRLQTADGTVVEAKLMKLASARVGKFTAEDVQCAVMPADKKDIPPLLGGSFLRHFLYKLSPESGKLTLTEVDAPASGPGEGSGRRPEPRQGPRVGPDRPGQERPSPIVP